MNLFSLFSVIFILELVARWQYLAIWFQLRMTNKSVIQDLGVKIKTAFINWDPSTGIWNISLVNNQRFRSCFSHDPASAHLLHIFTRSVSGSSTDLVIYPSIVENTIKWYHKSTEYPLTIYSCCKDEIQYMRSWIRVEQMRPVLTPRR